ncbi:unnamed protein product [Peronospora destructor]|uniref:NAD(P)-binding domain-containing protein n=1 Tax=Peronospora destructor TaxID=86335 RepID=A0AAV0T325_9STRA|nr:unnamed protein product [Peronospora destructor]
MATAAQAYSTEINAHVQGRAVQKGVDVRSLNRSGKPQWQDVPWIDEVDWHKGDVFDEQQLAKAVEGVTGVISAVGAFGSKEFMEKMCGDATIQAVQAAQKAGVERFVFRVQLSRWSEQAAVHARFPNTGVALRPGFIYGWRRTEKGRGIPLQLVGAPLSMLARDLAAVLSAVGPVHGQTLDTTNMLEIAASFHLHE